MPLQDITQDAVLKAIDEYNRLGKEAFLNRYGFFDARSYFLFYNGREYASKAIVGAAHGYAKPEIGPLKPHEFSGGDATVKRLLEDLGFQVHQVTGKPCNPDWTRDEIMLALEFYLLNRDKIPGKPSDEIIALSNEIRSLAHVLCLTGDEKFRNVNGVYTKIINIRSHDPAYTLQDKMGLVSTEKLEQEVWDRFGDDLPGLRKATALTRALLEGHIHEDLQLEFDEPEIEEASEGRIVTRLHRSRERSPKIVAQKKEAFLKSHDRLFCEACRFDFSEFYGERGRRFIECHHINPVHEMNPGEKTKLSDLKLVCANCHRMIHTKRPWLTMDELIHLVKTDF